MRLALLACALMLLAAPAQAVTCAAGGCTYQSLGCSKSGSSLYCSDKGIVGVVNINNIPTHVTHISLNGNKITGVAPGMFHGLNSLTQLWLNNNKITALAAGIFDGLNSLQGLWLYDNQIPG